MAFNRYDAQFTLEFDFEAMENPDEFNMMKGQVSMTLERMIDHCKNMAGVCISNDDEPGRASWMRRCQQFKDMLVELSDR